MMKKILRITLWNIGAAVSAIFVGCMVWVLIWGSPQEKAVMDELDGWLMTAMGFFHICLGVMFGKLRLKRDAALREAERARASCDEHVVQVNNVRRMYLTLIDAHVDVMPGPHGTPYEGTYPLTLEPVEPIHPRTVWDENWATNLPPGNARTP